MLRTTLAIGAAAVAAACAPAVAPAPATPAPADSLVLERTLCFGTCPAYRLSITRAGRVAFVSRNPGDSTRAVVDGAAPGAAEALARRAETFGATDHPTAIVTVFRPAGTARVIDYHGCYLRPDHTTAPALAALRRFEAAIDSAAGSVRWVRPASRRR